MENVIVVVAGHNPPEIHAIHLIWYPKAGEMMIRWGTRAWAFADQSHMTDIIAVRINPATNMPWE